LKAQREALTRYERFLPMLQLKKQQLQAEMLSIDHQVRQQENDEAALISSMEPWAALFSEPFKLEKLLSLKKVHVNEANIAGVTIPVFKDIEFEFADVDLFATPVWTDAGIAAIRQLAQLRAKKAVLLKQKDLIGRELRITTQRVNLFEKVKIPECRDNIRAIRIFLGDEQTASVARAKIAKRLMAGYDNEAA